MRLLDTTVAIDHLRGEALARDLVRRFVFADEQMAASEVVRFELFAGVRDDELEALEALCSMITWVDVSEPIARGAGGLARRYRTSHVGIGDVDYLIAATTLLLDAELLTTNVKHFPMLEGLRPAY